MLDALLALVYSLHLLALGLWVGTLAVLLAVLRPGRARPEDVPLLERARHRARVVARWSVVALIVTLAGEVGVRALLAAGGDVHAAYTGPALRALLFGSRYGEASVARWLLLVASLWVADEFERAPAAVPTRATRARRTHGHTLGIIARGPGLPRLPRLPRLAVTGDGWTRIAAILAAIVILCATLAGPYGASAPLAGVEALHLAATLLWLGGALALPLTILPFVPLVERSRRPLALFTLLDRLTPLTVLGVVAFLATGVWEALAVRGAPGNGERIIAQGALAVKTVLLVLLVGTASWGALALRPRLRRAAMRARRDQRLLPETDRALSRLQRLVTVNAALAAVALLCGGVAAGYPARADAAPAAHAARTPLHSLDEHRTGIRTIGAGPLTVSLHIAPVRSGPNTFDVRLTGADGAPVSGATVAVMGRSLAMRDAAPLSLTPQDLGGGRYRGRGTLAPGGRWGLRVLVRTGSIMAAAPFTLTAASAGPFGFDSTPVPRATTGTWRATGPATIVHALVANPATRTLLYEGTIDGVYRSTDGGTHWTPASTGLSGGAREVWSLTFLPDGSLVAATGAGIYRTIDAAAHWLPAGLTTRSIYTLAAHLAGHVVVLAGGDGGVFRSDDYGAHWREIYGAGAAAVTSLAWPSIRPNLIIAGLNPGPRSVVVSLDGGATWRTRTHGLSARAGMMSVAVAPGAHVAYAGSMGLGVYVLSDETMGPAASWQARNTGLPGLKTFDAHIGSFAFDLANPAALYAATDYGVYRSLDAGARWAPFGTGLAGDATVVTALTLVTGPRPVLYAATAAGLYRMPLPVKK